MAGIAFGLLAIAPQLITGITSVVKSVESIFGKGNGAAKKQAAVAMSSDLLNIYSSLAPSVGLTGAGTSDVQTALGNLIDAVVAFYNVTGFFVKSQTPAKP